MQSERAVLKSFTKCFEKHSRWSKIAELQSGMFKLKLASSTGVILDQTCVRLSEAALDHLFFSKIYFIKSSVNML